VNLRTKFSGQRAGGSAGFLLALLAGVVLLFSPFRLGQTLIRASYDWSFDLSAFRRPDVRNSDVVIVYLDQESHKTLEQDYLKPWDRGLHAQLLDRLTEDGARAVVFDILFTDSGSDPRADEMLAAAIRRNGRVILAADYDLAALAPGQKTLVQQKMLILPYEPFQNAAAGWGLALLPVEQDQDFTVRKHFNGLSEDIPSLSWATARFLNVDLTRRPGALAKERSLNYYGGPETIPSVSFARALPGGVPPGFFRNKVVFVGARPVAGLFGERRDELRSPFSSWGK
jgi:CHASE2 domain-containing sensor protein